MYRAEGAVEDQCDENQTQTCHDSGNDKSQNFYGTLKIAPPTLWSLSFGLCAVLVLICDGRWTYQMSNQPRISFIHIIGTGLSDRMDTGRSTQQRYNTFIGENGRTKTDRGFD